MAHEKLHTARTYVLTYEQDNPFAASVEEGGRPVYGNQCSHQRHEGKGALGLHETFEEADREAVEHERMHRYEDDADFRRAEQVRASRALDGRDG